jgi:hypothetical protein
MSRDNIQIPLVLAEKRLLSTDMLVQAVQCFIQEEGPLTDEEAERFVKILGYNPFTTDQHPRIING